MDTIPSSSTDGRRRRRLHSDEFKADAVAACMQPGVSMAAVAMSRGINANLLRRWVRLAELQPEPQVPLSRPASIAAAAVPTPPFVPLQLPAPAAGDIRIELRRGATTIAVTWPAGAASECATWMRELLR